VTSLEEQYAGADNLRARIALHERFSTNPYPYPRWVFDGYDFLPDAEVLEVGCGDGMIWRENADRIPDGWRLTLTDQSEGMVGEARETLADRARYDVARVEELPFEDASFDAVIANHMLFHVEDRRRAFSEIRRVLRAGRCFVSTTVGLDHLRELRELAPPHPGTQFAETRGRFMIETAEAELEPFFVDVTMERYEDSLRVTEVDPVVEFVRSRGGETADRLAAVRSHVEEAIMRSGAFEVFKDTARIRCRKA
jgi:ubiquinone/menaquinone biosynthesis C-methylase UbiE